MALALLLTVLSNALGILTVPFVLAHLLGYLGEIELAAGDLLAKLCLVILVPLFTGWYLRRFAEEWIARHRSSITTVSNLALISVPWMKFSQSAAVLSQVALANLGLIAISGLAIPCPLSVPQECGHPVPGPFPGCSQGRRHRGEPEDPAGRHDPCWP